MDTEKIPSQSHLRGMLQLPHEEMCALGYQVIDIIIDSFEHAADTALTPKANRPEMERLLREPLPEEVAPPNV